MGAYFFDSSALVKLYVEERGSGWVRKPFAPDTANDFYVARITPVEISSAIYRRVRAGSIVLTDAAHVVALVRQDLSAIFVVLEVTPALADQAIGIAEQFGLRGYDCIQLAAAREIERRLRAAQLGTVTLVSADEELNDSAQSLGMLVTNPNRVE